MRFSIGKKTILIAEIKAIKKFEILSDKDTLPNVVTSQPIEIP